MKGREVDSYAYLRNEILNKYVCTGMYYCRCWYVGAGSWKEQLILCHMTFDVARICLNSIIIFTCTAFMLVFSSPSNEPFPKTCGINNLCINFPSYFTSSVNCQTLSADQLFNTFPSVCFSLHYLCISPIILLFLFCFDL